ncbi:unnamed protein product [Paramecium sonneborni]|uniref:Homeodomain protein n=1 Tax=Paramecium sonneborni TaxID=65129 RepID=A0A8S1PQJ3_9CILI|nr:unnamed protein product [Paramecium sonneborni]
MFHEFLQELGTLKNSELPFPFRNQFKIKENFINPNSKHFDSIAQKLLSQEKASIKRKWDKQCKMMFIWILGKFFQLKNKKTINPTQDEWEQLSNILKIDEITIKQRWITLINPVSKSINWDTEEDEIIRSLMNDSDEKHIWTHIALELYNQNNGQYIRTPKQVRERWMNYLNPKLKKTNWSQQEDLQLLNMVVQNGKRWSLISSLLDGRTENQVKNRFKSLIQKIYKDEDVDDIEELQAIKEYLNKQNVQQIQEPQKEESQIRITYLRQVKNKTNQKQQFNKIDEIELRKKKRKTKKDVQQIDQQEPIKIQKDSLSILKLQDNKLKLKEEEIAQEIQVELQQQQQSLYDQQLKMQQQIQSQFLNENNKKELSTPNTLYYNIQPSFQKIEEYKNDQFGFRQVQQSPIQQPNQYLFQGFRSYQEEMQQQFQQTPVQMYMGQYFKNYPQNYNLISPFPQLNQTPMVYTPAQAMYMYNNSNPYNMGMSPLLIRSPYAENQSPNIAPQQQQTQAFWQTPPQYTSMDYLQNEQKMSMNKLEFLQSNNLVDKWKQKRVNEKQNASFLESFQSLDQ